jgi:glycosyltransferase involved in cell wall biosynthesis
LAELGETTGAVVVRTDTDRPASAARDLAAALRDLVDDEEKLTRIGRHAEMCRRVRSDVATADSFAAAWRKLLSNTDTST